MSNINVNRGPSGGQAVGCGPVAVGLGSNLGDRRRHLATGRSTLDRLLADLRCSRVYETEPVGRTSQPRFLNMCCVGRSAVPPRELLEALHATERRAGRDREGEEEGHGAPRRLDLDLLLFGSRRISEPGLEVPHPRMTGRAFVLAPLAELIPEKEVPGTGRTVAELAEAAGTDGIEPLGALDELLGETDAEKA